MPLVKYRGHCQLAPTNLQERLQEQAVRVHYEHRWGPNYRPGLSLHLDWFTTDQQRHLVAHQMRNLPTMMVLVERSAHRNVWLSTHCLMCNSNLHLVHHLRECPLQSHEWRPAWQRVYIRLTTYVGPQAWHVRSQQWHSVVPEQRSAAIMTLSL